MPASRSNTCLHCRWWEHAAYLDRSASGGKVGYCHFHAPVRNGSYDGGAFPPTQGIDWCSEFTDGRSYAAADDEAV